MVQVNGDWYWCFFVNDDGLMVYWWLKWWLILGTDGFMMVDTDGLIYHSKNDAAGNEDGNDGLVSRFNIVNLRNLALVHTMDNDVWSSFIMMDWCLIVVVNAMDNYVLCLIIYVCLIIDVSDRRMIPWWWFTP